MRAKFIYEKFSEDSDPVHDLGIGIMHAIKHFLTKESRYKTEPIIYPKDYLWMCAAEEKIDYIKALLNMGYDVNDDGSRALRCAIVTQNAPLVKFLLQKGAGFEPNDKWHRDWSYETAERNEEITRLLKEYNI